MPGVRLQASVAHEPRKIVGRTWDLAPRRWVGGNDVQILVNDLECAVCLTLARELPIAAGFITTAARARPPVLGRRIHPLRRSYLSAEQLSATSAARQGGTVGSGAPEP